ncbi:protein rolling stone-like isoform X1 [Mytilus edulis]|uniref:protein rolling stone-like isoform X1 n=2 Tax=Mytilus edulis TaxID=6550 RepID=UPI0039EED3D2
MTKYGSDVCGRMEEERSMSTDHNRCCESLVQEFKPDNIGLEYENPADLVTPQWPINHKGYAVYRVTVAVLMVGWIVADLMYESQKFYHDRIWLYLVYATNWSFVLLVLSTCFHAVCVMFYTTRAASCVDRQSFEKMPPSLKLQWVLQNLGYNSAIVVTISYWSFIAFLDHTAILMTDMSRLKHTLNTVFVIFDLMISATPIRILHMFIPVMLGSIYSLFNALYFLNNGTILEGRHYAYNVLNWDHPQEAIITCMLCMIESVLSQIILYELYKFRRWIYSKTFFGRENDLPYSEMQSIMTETPKYSAMGKDQQPDFS